MNTKEAIDNVNGVYAQVEGAFCCNAKERNEFEREENEVIELLQRGEKFEQVWGEFKKEIDLHNSDLEYDICYELMEKIERKIYGEEFKQKYFPKGGSQ